MSVWRQSLLWLALAIPSLASCRSVADQATMLPVRNALVFDQLVIYSNFALPQRHRLLDDLRVQRGDVLGKLSLAPSDEPIHVYLFDSEEHFGEFMEQHHPSFPTRRAFFLEDDTRLAVYAQWGDRVAEDLRHEVAHGYLHSVVSAIPLWLDEGLAEYFEVPRGQGGLNRPHVQLLLDKTLRQGWRPNLERLEQLTSAGEMNQDDYAEAWAWTHWLLDTTPERRALLQTYLAQIRDTGSVEPLSGKLRESQPQSEQKLVEHLYKLDSTQPPPGVATQAGR